MDQRLLSIYIGNEVIRVVDATRKSPTSMLVNSVDEVSTPNGCVDDGYITDVLEVASAIRSKIIGKSTKAKAVFTISSKKIASKEVVIPFVKGEKKIAAILNANSSDYFPMSATGDFLFAHNVMETFQDEEGKKLRINAVAAPTDLIEGYYELADELKLSVYDVDYVGNSVQQLLKLQMSSNEDETNLVLQIEKDATFVNVMAGKDIILQRSVPYGKNAVINSIMEIKKLTEKEAIELLKDKDRLERTVSEEEYSEAVRYLISSIGRIVEYHRSRNPERIIDGIKVFGEGASIAGIDDILKQELGADVTRFNSLQGIKVSQKSYLNSDQALRFLACFGAVLNPIGLRMEQGKNKENTMANADKILIVLIILATIVVGGLTVYFKINESIAKSKVDDRKQKIADMQSAEDLYNKYVGAMNAYNVVKSFDDTTHNDNIALTRFFADLENNLPTNTYIDELSAENGSVSFNVVTSSKEAVADIIKMLNTLDYVEYYEIPSLAEADPIITSYDLLNFDENENLDAALDESIDYNDLKDGSVTFPFVCKIKDVDFVAGELAFEVDPSQVEVDSSQVEGGEQ